MSEEPVDVNSKTSLAKRWLVLMKADFAKGAAGYTSVLNWAFMALAVWQFVGPIFADRGAAQATAQVAQLQTDLGNALSRATSAETALGQVKLGYEASQQDNAELAKKNDEMRLKLEATGEGPKQPLQKAALSPEPPIKNVKVRRTPLPPKADPTLYEQFVAWYESNVGTPGAN